MRGKIVIISHELCAENYSEPWNAQMAGLKLEVCTCVLTTGRNSECARYPQAGISFAQRHEVFARFRCRVYEKFTNDATHCSKNKSADNCLVAYRAVGRECKWLRSRLSLPLPKTEGLGHNEPGCMWALGGWGS